VYLVRGLGKVVMVSCAALPVFFCVIVFAASEMYDLDPQSSESAAQSTALRQLLEKQEPFVLFRPMARRLPRFSNGPDSERVVPRLRKRNNAEVVNYILKNFGTLDRLGDVGK